MNQETITEVIQFLTKNPGYLKWGKEKLASKLDCTVEEVREAKEKVKISAKYLKRIDELGFKILTEEEAVKDEQEELLGNSSENSSRITEFDSYLKAQGINPDEVKSVKYWQTAGGDPRFSVVTKNDTNTLPDIKEVIEVFQKEIKKQVLKEVQPDYNKRLVVFLADKHIGALTKPDSLYSNEYDAIEFGDRMQKVLNEINRVYVEQGTLKNVTVIDLGDALDGYNQQTTRGGHTLPQNMTNKEAFEVYVDTHKAFYHTLLNSGIAYDYNIYHLTNSNHGGEFDHFAARCLQEYINASYYGMQVSFEILDKFINRIYVGKHNYLLSHGKDSEDMKNGLPLTLDAKTEQYIINYILYHKISTENLHFIKGDLHQASTQWGKNFRYRNIPSVYGSSKWIMTNFGYSKPGCGFDLLNGNDVKQWELWF